MNGDLIIIDDDGCDAVGVIDSTKTISAPKASNDNTIVTNKKVIKKTNLRSDNNINVIDIDDYEETSPNPQLLCDETFNENRLLVKFIEKCLDLENSEGMLQIINQTLLPLYKQADPKFKTSHKFDRLMLKMIERLNREPKYKFTHMKCFCDTLKLHRVKRRVNFITLATKLDTKEYTDKITSTNSVKRISSSEMVKKKQKVDVIDLDNEKESVINLDDDHTDNDLIIDNQSLNQIDISDKENDVLPNNDPTVNENEFNREPNRSNNQKNDINVLKNGIPDKMCKRLNLNRNIISESMSNEKSHLEPEVVEVNVTNDLEKKIEDIERQIATHKELIAHWEVQEVCDDSKFSPYIMTEKLKADIVVLYKQLCKLTGEQPIKQRKVHFQVAPGHRPEPVRLLEKYLNANIGENGEPPFPDFSDVLTCVVAADRVNGQELNPGSAFIEANALFTHCGRAIQKRRQEREWRDLMSRVTQEVHDPADDDPELLAKLNENKRVAMKKEEHILQRFIEMENELKYSNRNRKLPISVECGAEQLIKYYNEVVTLEDSERETEATRSIDRGNIDNNEEFCEFKDNPIKRVVDGCIEENERTSSNPKNIVPIDDSPESDHLDDEDYEIVTSDEDSEQETEATSFINNIGITNITKEPCEFKDNPLDGVAACHKDVKEIIVKKEPEDISILLSGLGDNFTATIVDIEDPFLVIEISSDSESEDEEILENTKDVNVTEKMYNQTNAPNLRGRAVQLLEQKVI